MPVAEKLKPDFDLSAEGFPHMAMKEGKFGQYPVRIYRLSFSGELSYEVATPRQFRPRPAYNVGYTARENRYAASLILPICSIGPTSWEIVSLEERTSPLYRYV
jgi:glycine cleavage system aminomethyltransferase T